MTLKQYTLLIGGERVATPHHAEVRNPSTGDVVGLMPLASEADLDRAVAAAAAAFEGWSRTDDALRANACRTIAERLAENAEDVARLLTLEQGKPLNGLGSRFELGGALAWTRHTAELSLPVEVVQDDNEGRVEIHRKPVGVTGSITPWNWPVMIACWHIIPAVRAGNTVVIKPSPLTPLSTIRLVEIINEVLPPGVQPRGEVDDAEGGIGGGDVAQDRVERRGRSRQVGARHVHPPDALRPCAVDLGPHLVDDRPQRHGVLAARDADVVRAERDDPGDDHRIRNREPERTRDFDRLLREGMFRGLFGRGRSARCMRVLLNAGETRRTW